MKTKKIAWGGAGWCEDGHNFVRYSGKECPICKNSQSLQDKPKPPHTPTPWEVGSEGRIVEIATKQTIAKVAGYENQVKEDAAFIVTSVNCHEELVESLRECVQLMGENVNYQEDKDFKLAVDSACEAIAKAEKQS